jgi:Protein of unknown function (DUF2946)
MRRQLGKLLPIVMLAIWAQILAPIVIYRTAGAAAATFDASVICAEHLAAQGQPDQPNRDHLHDSCYIHCCLTKTAQVAFDSSVAASIMLPDRQFQRVHWQDTEPDLLPHRVGTHAQARAPPFA